MPRKSPVHYIAPSAISIVPNANNKASDLAVYVARGTKIKVYSPAIEELGWGADNTYQEWTMSGRNRRLADDAKPYTIYARLSKTDKANGYLVFAPRQDRNAGVAGAQPDWHDKYNYVTVEGMTQIEGALTDQNYWYIRLGDVTEPESGQRTVELDTGILTTDQYNMNWATNPDNLPLRVEIGCTVGDEDAGPAPYVNWDQSLVLTASLMEGWTSKQTDRFDHWEITRIIGDGNTSEEWPDKARADAFKTSGSIRIDHLRDGRDDFNGAVAATFTVMAMGRNAGPEPSEESEETPSTPSDPSIPSAPETPESSGSSEGSENSEPSGDEETFVPIASASVTIYAETAESYEIVLSSNVVSARYDDEEQKYIYIPEDGISMRVRATDQKGTVSDMTYGQFVSMGLALEYMEEDAQSWTSMPVGGATDDIVTAVMPPETFAHRKSIVVRLVRAAGQEAKELTRTTILFIQNTEDTKEREWIFLRSDTEIIFGDSSHPEPSAIPGGQVNPEEAATGGDTNKNQDGWVPQGWWDEEHGVDGTWFYEYASYRDYVPASTYSETEEPVAAHWGPFVKAFLRNHYTGSISEEEVVEIVNEEVGQKYISKLYDDIANGVITFLKGIKIGAQKIFGWDENGNITANRLSLSLEAKINEIRSHNNSGSGIFESGWFVTNNHNGHSYLEVDELFVRMKAVFAELEIRKETHSGGNVFYSPAGSVICRVEYYNSDGERIGITKTERRSPITAGGKMLSLMKSLASTLGILSYDKTIITEVPVDHSQVAFYRCYLIADDGTVQTRNWWQANDQARCQTFNRASQKSETGQSDAPDVVISEQNNYIQDQMDGNRFYWRLVLKAGSKKLEDGKWYDYVDLSNQEAGIGYVTGSDYPAAGDTIVCIGNRSNPERMNLVMLEVIGDDAPAIKMYRGVNSFSFDGKKFWHIGNRLQFRADSIEYVTGNGQVLPPKLSLGPWVIGQRYHYYEEVSHNGSLWLCNIIDGYRWEKADGTFIMDEMSPVFADEGTFAYGSNLQFTEHYYNTMEYEGVTIYLVRKYTTVEPSDNTDSWSVEVAKGDDGHVVLTEEDKDDIASRVTDLPAGYTLCINPETLFIDQNEPGLISFSQGNTYYYFADVTVYDHNGDLVSINITNAKAYGRSGNSYVEMYTVPPAVINNSRIALSGIAYHPTGSNEYEYDYDNGYIDFSIRIIRTEMEDVVIEHQKLSWYLNQLGSRVVKVMGDVSTTYCTKSEYSSNGGVVKKNEFNSMFETSAEHIYARLDVNEEDIAELEITAKGLKSSVTSSNLENLVDNTGWKTWESESTAIYDADTMRVSNLPNEDDLYSNAVFLERNKTYVFSLYTNEDFDTEQGVQVVRFYKCGDNPDASPSSLSEFVYCPVSTIATDVYQNQPRRYCTITPNFTEYYKVDVYGPTSFYRAKLEAGSVPTTWFATSSEIKQTADSIDLSIRHDLEETGIYIDGASKKIDMQADKFTLKNSSGQKTLGVNADGDFEVSGIVKANSLYRTVAICISSESINILEAGGSTKRCIFIKSLTESQYSQDLADRYGFNVEDYFYLTPAMITSGEFDDGISMGDFVVCTGNADIILPMDNYNANYLENRNKWRDGTWVRLPEASHCAGKVVEIRHHLTQGNGSIVISTVKQTAYAIVFAPMINDDMQISYNRGYDSGASAYFQWPAGTIIPLYSNGSNWISLGSIRNVNT